MAPSLPGITQSGVRRGVLCGAFAYPNDYHVAWGAERLSHDLKKLARRMPKRQVALVTH